MEIISHVLIPLVYLWIYIFSMRTNNHEIRGKNKITPRSNVEKEEKEKGKNK